MDYSKPTAQMLGRWQPFHDGHLALFKEILKKTGQVVIMVHRRWWLAEQWEWTVLQ